jgi:hypothetical protein
LNSLFYLSLVVTEASSYYIRTYILYLRLYKYIIDNLLYWYSISVTWYISYSLRTSSIVFDRIAIYYVINRDGGSNILIYRNTPKIRNINIILLGSIILLTTLIAICSTISLSIPNLLVLFKWSSRLYR